jgi:hypothetical protein
VSYRLLPKITHGRSKDRTARRWRSALAADRGSGLAPERFREAQEAAGGSIRAQGALGNRASGARGDADGSALRLRFSAEGRDALSREPGGPGGRLFDDDRGHALPVDRRSHLGKVLPGDREVLPVRRIAGLRSFVSGSSPPAFESDTPRSRPTHEPRGRVADLLSRIP